ncbi:MAG: porin [Planctomycetota bacterium]
MRSKWIKRAVCAAVAAGAMTPMVSSADELAELKARVAELERQQNQTWLSERQAQEVKSLIAETLQDADTRASLLADDMTAGWKKKFFLQSGDGAFSMTFGGQLQFRYVLEAQTDSTSGDDTDSGFQLRRTKLKIEGNVYDDWGYEIVFSGDREDGSVGIEDFVIERKLGEVTIKVGKFKLPFLREELLSSSRQLAVDRSISTEFFTLDRSEQIQVSYGAESFKVMISLSDGLDEEFSDGTNGDAGSGDPVEIAITGRVDFKVFGDWGQMKDFVAWLSDEDAGLFIGLAVHFQSGDGNNPDNSSEAEADYIAWTIDALFESSGFSVMAAYIGGSVIVDDGATIDSGTGDRDPMAFLVQAGYMVTEKIQPFVRYDFIDPDFAGTENLQALTFGLNYFIEKHKVKLTGDVVWVFAGDLSPAGVDDNFDFGNDAFSSGLGFSGGNENAEDDSIFVVRLQLQVLF